MGDFKVELGGVFLHNNTYDYSDYTYEDEVVSVSSAAVCIPLLYSIVLAVGLPAHALVLFLALKKQCWTKSDIFILHLSIADILLLVTLPLWAAQAALPKGWDFGLFLCRITGVFFNISFYSGMLLLVCITLECYLSIVHSVQLFTQKTPRLAHFTCLVIWVVSLLLSIPDCFFLEYIHMEAKTPCAANFYKSKWHVTFRGIHHVVALLPEAALIIFYCFLVERPQRCTKGREKMKRIMLNLVLVLVFTSCWMPYNITLTVDTFRAQSKTSTSEETALLATSALACVHGCLRPLIYFAICKKFREKALALIRCTEEDYNADLWELGLGTENLQDQSHDPEELKQMTSVEHQVQSGQC